MLNGLLENLAGGSWESKNEACRSIRKWESSEGRKRHAHAELNERFAVIVALRSLIEAVGTGHYQTAARVYGDVDVPMS